MRTISQDLQFGARSLMRRPSITIVTLLTLALGIGANTAIFSVVDAVLLRPLAYRQPDRMVFLSETSQQVPDLSISMPDFDDWRSMNTVFESMAPYQTTNVVMTGLGEPERLRMRRITAGFFPTTGSRPILGRALTSEDDKVGAAPVVLISEGFWTRKYARAPSVLGQKINLDGELYTIIGVLDSSCFHGSWRQQSLFSSLWRLENELGGPAHRGDHPGVYALARLKPGVPLAQAQSQMSDIAVQFARQYPDTNKGHGIGVDSLMNAYVGDIRRPLLILTAAVGFVLLIACANVANLMLARASERRREMGIRVALGASRRRLLRRMLTESLLLALLGGALGLAVAAASTGMLTWLASANVPRMDELAIDRWVLVFAMGVSIFTSLFFGLLPAWQAAGTDVQQTLKEGTRGAGTRGGRKRVRAALIVSEVAVSMVLLTGAGLALKSLYRVLRADPGFDDRGVLTAGLSLPEKNFAEQAQLQVINQVTTKLQAIPGVQYAAFEWPLLGGAQGDYLIEGKPVPAPSEFPSVDMTVLTPDAFRAMGVRLLKGRYFTPLDNEKSQRVCIVDTVLAKIGWSGQDPVGKRIAVGGTPQQPEWSTVVGVVSHVKNYGVDQPSREEMYVPIAQRVRSTGTLLVRSTVDPASLAGAVKSAMYTVNPDVPLYDIRPLHELVDQNTATRRLSAILLGVFAALALVLAAIGLYGVMSYSVTQRAREIGVRIALGAQRGDVFRLVLGSGMALVLVGLVIGLVGALYLSRFMQSLLFELKPTDMVTFASVPAILAAVALVACYLPARRAMRVDPIIALREE